MRGPFRTDKAYLSSLRHGSHNFGCRKKGWGEGKGKGRRKDHEKLVKARAEVKCRGYPLLWAFVHLLSLPIITTSKGLWEWGEKDCDNSEIRDRDMR